jgi:hypothetical protein
MTVLQVIKGFPRGLDPSTVNTQQVKQLLQQLIDRSSYRQQLRRASSSRISRSSGHGEAVSHSTPEGAQTAGAACCAATTTSRRSSCHEQQQQQQAGAGAVSQQQHSTVQHACAISCSAPGPSSGKQQQQCNGATGHYHLQQQQHVHVPCAVSAVKQSLDTRLDAGHVSSVTTCSEQLEQKQQEQQHSEVSTSSVHTAVNSVKQLHSEDGLIASLVSIPAHLHTQSLAASGGGANAHGCSSSSSQSAAEAADDSEDDDGDCLVIEPKWVTPDGCEVDLNKVSDYELRLAKVRAMPNPSMLSQGGKAASIVAAACTTPSHHHHVTH